MDSKRKNMDKWVERVTYAMRELLKVGLKRVKYKVIAAQLGKMYEIPLDVLARRRWVNPESNETHFENALSFVLPKMRDLGYLKHHPKEHTWELVYGGAEGDPGPSVQSEMF